MNFSLLSRRSLAFSCAVSLLGSPAFLQARSTLAAVAVAAATGDSAVPTFFPVTAQTGRQGVAFTYQVAADNSPANYSATGLPAGVAIDPASGLISGVPTANGTFTATLSATNASGVGTATLSLVIAPPYPVITVAAGVVNGYPAQGLDGTFTLLRSGDTSADVVVSFYLKGSAVNGEDFSSLKLSKKIKAGKTSRNVTIRAVDESGQGLDKKSVKLYLQPGEDYSLGTTTSAKVKINYTP